MEVTMNTDAERLFLFYPQQINHATGEVFGSHEHAYRLIEILKLAQFADQCEIGRMEKLIGYHAFDLISFVFSRRDLPDQEVAVLIPVRQIMSRKDDQNGMIGDWKWRPEPCVDMVFAPACQVKWGPRP